MTKLTDITTRVECPNCHKKFTGTWDSEMCPHCAYKINQENIRFRISQKYEYLENSTFTKVGRGLDNTSKGMKKTGEGMQGCGCGLMILGILFFLLMSML